MNIGHLFYCSAESQKYCKPNLKNLVNKAADM